MKYVLCALLVMGCGSGNPPETNPACIPTNQSLQLTFAEDSGDCGPITSFSENINSLGKCNSLLEKDECNYELIDECPNSYEELFLDFDTNTGLYYLETPVCFGLYTVRF